MSKAQTISRLSAVERKFILHWGEMGTRWGVSRSVAQIHALLYLLGRPLHAEEIGRASCRERVFRTV